MASGSNSTDDIVATARVGSSHGVRGAVSLISLSGETEHLVDLGAVELRSPSGTRRAARVTFCRVNGTKLIAGFDGVESREAARALTGWEVWVRRSQASALRDEEFYVSDLQDARVFQAGQLLGTIRGIVAGGPADLLEVEQAGGGQPFFVPFLTRFVPVVDLARHQIELEPGPDWRIKP